MIKEKIEMAINRSGYDYFYEYVKQKCNNKILSKIINILFKEKNINKDNEDSQLIKKKLNADDWIKINKLMKQI